MKAIPQYLWRYLPLLPAAAFLTEVVFHHLGGQWTTRFPCCWLGTAFNVMGWSILNGKVGGKLSRKGKILEETWLPCCYLNAPHPLGSVLDSSRLRATSWYFMIFWLAMLDIRICVLSPTWDNYQQPQLEYELANAESSHHLDATYHSKK